MIDINKVIKDAEKKAKTKEAIKLIIRNNVKLLAEINQPEDEKERVGYWKGLEIADQVFTEFSDGLYLVTPRMRV